MYLLSKLLALRFNTHVAYLYHYLPLPLLSNTHTLTHSPTYSLTYLLFIPSFFILPDEESAFVDDDDVRKFTYAWSGKDMQVGLLFRVLFRFRSRSLPSIIACIAFSSFCICRRR
jgi:hypothetical protein